MFAQDFKLYLLPAKIKSAELAKHDLKKLRPEGELLLKAKDFWYYFKDTHELTIDYFAALRIKKLRVPEDGRPFVVFVDDEPIYTGAFWKGFSSLTFKGVAVDLSDLKGDFPTIRLELDYPPLASKNISRDPRSDERIFKAFEKAGRLFEEVWLQTHCQSFRGTGKRRQSYVFNLAVEKVLKNSFTEPEISFELYFDSDGGDLLAAVEGRWEGKMDGSCDPDKKILLKIYRQVGGNKPKIMFKDFEKLN